MSDLLDLVRRMGENAGGTMAVLEILLRVTLLLTAALFLILGLRRTSASLRHLVWTVSLVGTLLIPLFSWAFPAWRWAILPQPEQVSSEPVMEQAADGPDSVPTRMGLSASNAFDAPVGESLDLSAALSGVDTEESAVSDPASSVLPEQSWSWPAILAAVWAAGTSLGLIWLGVGVVGAWYVARRAQLPADSPWRLVLRQVLASCDFRRPVEVRECAWVSVPMTWGVRRPVILAPVGSGAWSEATQRSVLLHELGHIRRGDCLMHLVGRLACVVYWFHPLVWLAARQSRKASEQAADDMVLSTDIAPSDYAEQLVGIAAQIRGLPWFGHAALPMASPSDLERRVVAILDPQRNHRSLKRKTCYALLVLATLLLVPCAVLRLGYAEEDVQTCSTSAEESESNPAEQIPSEALLVPIPVAHDGRTTLDSILKRLAEEEKRYDSLEVTATTTYKHLNLEERLVGDCFVACLSSQTRERNVCAGDRLYHNETRENKMADGTSQSSLLRQACDGHWTRECRQDCSTKPGMKLDGWASIGLGPGDSVRLLRAHTILFHDDRIKSQLLATFLASGWFDVRGRSAMTVEYVGDEQIGDLYCHKLKCALQRNGKVTAFFLAWLARDRNLLAVRHEWREPHHSRVLPTSVSCIADLREIRPGQWFPFKATCLAYRKREGLKEGRALLQWRRDMQVDKVTLAPQLDETLFSVVEVPKGETIVVQDRGGERIGKFTQPRTGNIEITPEKFHAMLQEYESNEDDKYTAQDATAPQRERRINAAWRVLRSDPRAAQNERIEASLEVFRNYDFLQTNPKKWASAIRELIVIGKPAIPRLIDELDTVERMTNQERELRALGFVLRGIGDARAVPALIRALPYTLQPLRSDYGLSVEDRELLRFMQEHDKNRTNGGDGFSFGRPINEILPALQQLTGVTSLVPGGQDDQAFKNIHHIFSGANDEANRKLFLRFAECWADWWAKNWQFHVKDAAEAQLDQTKKTLDRIAKASPSQPPATPPATPPASNAPNPAKPAVSQQKWSPQTLLPSQSNQPNNGTDVVQSSESDRLKEVRSFNAPEPWPPGIDAGKRMFDSLNFARERYTLRGTVGSEANVGIAWKRAPKMKRTPAQTPTPTVLQASVSDNTATVRGRVLDHEGKPVKDARVFPRGRDPLRTDDGKLVWFPSHAEWGNGQLGVGNDEPSFRRWIANVTRDVAQTDADGRFRLVGQRKDLTQIVVLARQSYVWVVSVPAEGSKEEVTIHLPPPATLKVIVDIPGAVQGNEGRPVLDFGRQPRGPAGRDPWIRLQLMTATKEGWERTDDVVQVRTVANPGEVVFSDLTPGLYDLSRYKMFFLGDRGGGDFCDRQLNVKLLPGETKVIRMVRKRGQRASGEIHGLPKEVPGAWVSVCPIEATGDPKKMLDEWKLPVFDCLTCQNNAEFLTSLLEPGQYRVVAHAYQPEPRNGVVYTGWHSPDYVGTALVTIEDDDPADPKKPRPSITIEMKPRQQAEAGDATAIPGASNRDSQNKTKRSAETTIAKSLNWLNRHQAEDGRWSFDFGKQCKGKACSDCGKQSSDSEATGLALLPFLAAGQTHKEGKYHKTVAKGIDWLVKQQEADGNLAGKCDHPMRAHAVATFALCSALGITKDADLEKVAQKAVEHIVQSQDKATGGWRDSKDAAGHIVDFGWQLIALKSAERAGLKVSPDVWPIAKKWLNTVSRGEHRGLYADHPGDAPTPLATAVGMLCSQYLGMGRDDPAMQESAKYLADNMPEANKQDVHYWFFATFAMHPSGGAAWDAWSQKLRRLLTESQVTEGCAAGSWSPSESDRDGRLAATCLNAIALEVYYRFLPLNRLDEKKPVAAGSARRGSPAIKAQSS